MLAILQNLIWRQVKSRALGVCVIAGVPSLAGLDLPTLRTPHLRAGLSYFAAARLERCAFHFFVRPLAMTQTLWGRKA